MIYKVFYYKDIYAARYFASGYIIAANRREAQDKVIEELQGSHLDYAYVGLDTNGLKKFEEYISNLLSQEYTSLPHTEVDEVEAITYFCDIMLKGCLKI